MGINCCIPALMHIPVGIRVATSAWLSESVFTITAYTANTSGQLIDMGAMSKKYYG